MSWFKRKPTEDQLERSVLFAAMLARAKERDTKQLTTNDDIQSFLNHAFNDIGVKPGKQERGVAAMGVQALLTESTFIDEALDYRLANGGAAMPPNFRGKMLDAMQKTVDDFKKDSGRS